MFRSRSDFRHSALVLQQVMYPENGNRTEHSYVAISKCMQLKQNMDSVEAIVSKGQVPDRSIARSSRLSSTRSRSQTE